MEEAMDAGCAVSGWLKSVRASTMGFLEDAAMRRRLRAEFSGLGCDLDRVLADIGLTREDMEALIRNSPRSRALQQAMLKRLGLEQRVASLAPDVSRSI